MINFLGHETYTAFLEIDITPEYSIDLVGFNREDNQSRGILHRLYAQIILFRKNDTIYSIVTIDNIGLTVNNSNKIRKYIADTINTDISNIMLCYTHTHSAPDAESSTEKSVKYFEFLRERICEGVMEANSNLIRCKVGWGFTSAEIGINRRNTEGSLNKRIGIFKVTNSDTNELVYIMLRVSAHGNVLVRDNYLISSDYIGTTRVKLKERYGCGIIITQGASGNINPMYQGKIEDLEKMSDAIYMSLFNKIEEIDTKNIEQLKMYSIFKRLSTTDIPSCKDTEILASTASKEYGIDASLWLEGIKSLQENGIKNQFWDIEIQFFQVNEGILCGIPMEPFCEMALDIQEKVQKSVFFGGYTNGCDGYLPTYNEYFKGGYEVSWSYLIYGPMFQRLMPLKPETEKIIVDTIVEVLDELNTVE